MGKLKREILIAAKLTLMLLKLKPNPLSLRQHH
jgi:hypothetical protein